MTEYMCKQRAWPVLMSREGLQRALPVHDHDSGRGQHVMEKEMQDDKKRTHLKALSNSSIMDPSEVHLKRGEFSAADVATFRVLDAMSRL